MKPRIGIAADARRDPADDRSLGRVQLNWNYAYLVAEAGGVPLIVPPMADMAELAGTIDGWLIPGGDDLDPALWGEAPHPKSSLQDPVRFAGERTFFEAAPRDLPILGICYGAQALNVLMGGTLEQHVPDRVGHEEHAGGTLQTYAIEPGSRLASVVQATEVAGKSYHHQAIAQVAPGLRAVARHDDGTVEAVEGTAARWLIGVQWHPERTPADPATVRLFEAFVEAARSFRRQRSRVESVP